MDGNGRWAQRRHLPRTAGHRAGIKAVRATVEHSVRRGVGALTLFAFSSENWRRPADEVDVLMKLFLEVLGREVDELARAGRAPALHRRPCDARPACASRACGPPSRARRATPGWSSTSPCPTAAAGTSSRQRAHRGEAQRGELDPASLDEAAVGARLALARAPDPDLFIRTGGEHRISNFLLWNLAYTELYFCDTLWPDFGEADYDAAIECFARRERRFGLTSGQVKGAG
jgi:undecaprenyl diphosphate synthase